MKSQRQSWGRRAIAFFGLTVLAAGTIQVVAAPAAQAAPAIFSDDFDSGTLANWTSVTRLTIDTSDGSPSTPSARAQVINQSAYAYHDLGASYDQACLSENVNLTSGSGIDLFRLRTAANGPLIKAFVAANGILQIRSDFASTTASSGVALGTGWHNVELCGTVGPNTTWSLYRDGVRIVNAWHADTGTVPIGRIQIGYTAAKTSTVRFDHVILDQMVGDEGHPGDTDAPTTPGQPSGTSPSTTSIQIGWLASTDASSPITYRIYRDASTNPVGSTTATSFTDTGLTSGSSHTYTVDAVDPVMNVSQRSTASSPIIVASPSPGGQPVPGHTSLAPETPRTDVPRITTGEITDMEYIGNHVYIAGTFTSIRNNTATNTTTVNQPILASYNIDTGLIDTAFRPTFGGGGVTEIATSPDGTKLFVVGRFSSVNGVTKRKVASINPTTGATVTGFTANANAAATSVDATNTTVYIGGQFTTINSTPRVALAAVNAGTGQVVSGFVNNLSGGIGVNGELSVQALVLSHDSNRLLVVHTGRQIAGQDRYGVGMIDTQTNQLLPWRTRLWDDNLRFVGGIQRVVAGDIAPNDQYFVVTSGSGGDRPPVNDTAIAFSMAGNDNVEPLWISRCFDSVYSVAISEVAVYLGGHYNYQESPTSPDPWPGLTTTGYGQGQGLAGYSLGDDIVTRDHIGAVDPATGKALEFDPGSNSFEGNKAMLVTPRGLFAGGDATTQGGYNVGRVAFYDFNAVAAPGADETTITTPIQGRVEPSGVPFTADGTATATSGVQRVQLEVRERDTGQYLQDDLVTWGSYNTIDANLASPGATSSAWSLSLTVAGDHRLQLQAKTFATDGSGDATKAIKRFETFGLADATPETTITGPAAGVVPTTTFTVTGTAHDDVGVNAILFTLRDADNQYLQADGTTDNVYHTFRGTPDVIGAPDATWSYEVTVPYESEWTMQAIAVDTAGQDDLRSNDRKWIVNTSAIAPSVAIIAPAVVNPPTNTSALTLPPGSPLTFSGSATDDQSLNRVEISLRNNATRENLATDGSWGTDVVAGWYRITPLNLNASSYNWSYTTPFNLRPGSYAFSVRAVDDLGLITASTNVGKLTINVQVPGDAFPNGLLDATDTQPALPSLHLNLAGSATDDRGVAAVRVTLQDQVTGRYVQPDGTASAAYSLLDAVMTNPGATSTRWSLSVDLPAQGAYAVTAVAYDTSGQQDPSTTGATALYPAYPGDQAPTVTEALLAPTEGTAFTGARIFVSGRLEDDHQIAEAQVAIRNALGRYMDASGTFTSTAESWRTVFLNSPGSPGSNFSYTTPAIPSGSYTVLVRGVDQHGFITPVPSQRHVTVSAPPNNVAPVANFTYGCVQNVCSFDGRSSTDENAPTLTYAWNFGSGTGSGPLATKTYTSASTYTVTLTVTDEYGLTATASHTIPIVQPSNNVAPVPVINPPSCVGLACNISGLGSADPNVGDTFTYRWNFGDGKPASGSTAPTHSFPAPGTYTVTLTVTDGWGRAASTTRVITVA